MHHQATLRLLHADSDAEAAIGADYESGVAARRPDMGVFLLSQRIWLFLERGRAGEVLEDIRQFTERVPYPLIKAAYAFLLAEIGQPEPAEALFDELAATGFAQPTNNVGWLHFHAMCASLCARFGRADCIPPSRPVLEPWADQLIVASFAGWVSGPVSFYLGLLGHDLRGLGPRPRPISPRPPPPRSASTPPSGWPAPAWSGPECFWPGRDRGRGAGEDLLRQALDIARERGLANIERDAVASRSLSGP